MYIKEYEEIMRGVQISNIITALLTSYQENMDCNKLWNSFSEVQRKKQLKQFERCTPRIQVFNSNAIRIKTVLYFRTKIEFNNLQINARDNRENGSYFAAV